MEQVYSSGTLCRCFCHDLCWLLPRWTPPKTTPQVNLLLLRCRPSQLLSSSTSECSLQSIYVSDLPFCWLAPAPNSVCLVSLLIPAPLTDLYHQFESSSSPNEDFLLNDEFTTYQLDLSSCSCWIRSNFPKFPPLQVCSCWSSTLASLNYGFDCLRRKGGSYSDPIVA